MYRSGTIDEATLRSFRGSDHITSPEIKPVDIRRIRKRNKVTQKVFARYLNASDSTVARWESGAQKSGRMALKLLYVVEKHGLKMLA